MFLLKKGGGVLFSLFYVYTHSSNFWTENFKIEVDHLRNLMCLLGKHQTYKSRFLPNKNLSKVEL